VPAVLRFSDEYCRVEEDTELRLVRYVRNAVPFPTPDVLRYTFVDVTRELDRLGRQRCALLIDVREARGINDADFEEAMKRARRKMIQGFQATAVLVTSAAGALQVRRHVTEDNMGTRVFQDEGESVAYLVGALQGPRSERPSVPPKSERYSVPPAPKSERHAVPPASKSDRPDAEQVPRSERRGPVAPKSERR